MGSKLLPWRASCPEWEPCSPAPQNVQSSTVIFCCPSLVPAACSNSSSNLPSAVLEDRVIQPPLKRQWIKCSWETITTWWHKRGWEEKRISGTGTNRQVEHVWSDGRKWEISEQLLSPHQDNHLPHSNGEDGDLLDSSGLKGNGTDSLASFLLGRRLTREQLKREEDVRNLSGLTLSDCRNLVLPHMWWTGSWGAPAADMTPCGNGCSHLEKVHTPESCFSGTFNIDTSGTHSAAHHWKGRAYKGTTWQENTTMDGRRRGSKTTMYFKLLDSTSLKQLTGIVWSQEWVR